MPIFSSLGSFRVYAGLNIAACIFNADYNCAAVFTGNNRYIVIYGV
ncbi:MAG: hypothetical protein IIT49_01955 [Clostridia bacterium]|nr:hypothetical protein [Clostridia bacterium]MBQ5439528.1 hypothetical protein [Clostridia bacterium]